MNSSYNKKIFTTISILGIVFSFIQIFGDIAWIKDHSQLGLNINLYLYPRIVIFAGFVGVYFYFKNKILDDVAILSLAACLTIYSVHGQQFSPGYFMAYMQSILAFSLFFAIPKKKFIPLLVGSGFLMILSVMTSHASYSSIVALENKFKADISVSILIINILSFFGYRFITLVREQKDKLTLKFSDIGKNTASIIHDIKGVACAPQLYIELIQAKVDSGNFEGIDKDLIRLQEEYDNLVEYVKDLNNVSKEKEGIKKFDILSLSNSVGNIFLKSRMKGTKFSVKGVQFVEADFQLTRSILTNLIVNSLDAFEAKKITDRQINVEISKQKIKFMDNAGGFPEEVLERVKRKESMTTKENGSGLGLFLIQEYMNEQGGKAHFYNEDSKAVVELHFKENNIKK